MDQKNLQVRIPVELHRRLKMQAIREGVTVKDLLTRIISKYLVESERKSGPPST